MPETQASAPTPDILTRIVATKRREIEAMSRRAAEFRGRARDAAPARDFAGALGGHPRVRVIAEVKRRSPGAGPIRPDLDPGALAAVYERAGAAALSVLTDADYFGGDLSDLRVARGAVGLPALRKDFTLARVQIDEARAAGADAILLIVRILDDALLADLHGYANERGLAALVEVHDAAELERAIAVGARVVGINNRDLSNFRTDLAVTESLLTRLPADTVVVSESGIRVGSDVERLGAAGVDAILVGESILRAPDPGAKVAELASAPRIEGVRG
ncbi:MAG: indole-3-glycerol phosphate synthase TrpC [Gemmatimonadetes bacterium]|nr:indole-3-glycerol phosphate synthase TrpC [Gemmatimonadota bacterium]